ncbi:MAG: gluconate 2-dehydrogenase subunit 3 family protein [Gammaproteobacteria bacterium]|nr:MAG: gluconate 2-dehydrogenase subunit 3 family protein [Gammaproteobacteria bacterium]
MGGTLSAPAMLGVLDGCRAAENPTWKPRFLSEGQAELVAEVAEIMIPRTATPGAKDVGVPAFIDAMLKDTYPREDRERYLSGLEAFDAAARAAHGEGFVRLDAPRRLALVQRIHDIALAEESAAGPHARTLRRPFILMTKELALLGFFTSRVGATQVLQYVAIPGSYHACVPLAQAGDGKTWAVETGGRF